MNTCTVMLMVPFEPTDPQITIVRTVSIRNLAGEDLCMSPVHRKQLASGIWQKKTSVYVSCSQRTADTRILRIVSIRNLAGEDLFVCLLFTENSKHQESSRGRPLCMSPVHREQLAPGIWQGKTSVPQQADLRLSGPPSGQGAGNGVRTRNKRIPTEIRADSLATVPPTPPTQL
ncbi:hypothetical protein PoB_004760300 [Plakobranchus ocellatus]|uniref:Uncharacterized protein n=1 Tax=Plakobranchus ocellatus TaxID=259542 RepID=A0AAV4BNC7_9GAST|nr:hypothetical protein PoB_004760300 [Plakobranchus ocellatus]